MSGPLAALSKTAHESSKDAETASQEAQAASGKARDKDTHFQASAEHKTATRAHKSARQAHAEAKTAAEKAGFHELAKEHGDAAEDHLSKEIRHGHNYAEHSRVGTSIASAPADVDIRKFKPNLR